jgi:hypothetical protein
MVAFILLLANFRRSPGPPCSNIPAILLLSDLSNLAVFQAEFLPDSIRGRHRPSASKRGGKRKEGSFVAALLRMSAKGERKRKSRSFTSFRMTPRWRGLDETAAGGC